MFLFNMFWDPVCINQNMYTFPDVFPPFLFNGCMSKCHSQPAMKQIKMDWSRLEQTCIKICHLVLHLTRVLGTIQNQISGMFRRTKQHGLVCWVGWLAAGDESTNVLIWIIWGPRLYQFEYAHISKHVSTHSFQWLYKQMPQLSIQDPVSGLFRMIEQRGLVWWVGWLAAGNESTNVLIWFVLGPFLYQSEHIHICTHKHTYAHKCKRVVTYDIA